MNVELHKHSACFCCTVCNKLAVGVQSAEESDREKQEAQYFVECMRYMLAHHAAVPLTLQQDTLLAAATC